ncbi:MAG: penicillin-binding protein 2 [Alphaproteobacteria bacterium]|nr:penicillin-binding protein 2 [Alphaproteobacteria bacterium]
MNAIPRPIENIRIAKSRMGFAVCLFLVGYLAVGLRLADLTLLRGGDGTAIHTPQKPAIAQSRRADITDRNGTLLASALEMAAAYADTTLIKEPSILANDIHAILPDENKDKLVKKLSSGKKFVWLRRDLTPKQEYALNALGSPAINFQSEDRRIYPAGALTAHIVGYTDIDGIGIAGIEKSFDASLRDKNAPLQLTLDLRVQHILRNALQKRMKEFSAVGATGIVMDVHTGEIIAMVSLPDFDPHKPGDAKSRQRFSTATLGVYEMGSTFKLFSTAAALEAKQVSFSTSFDTKEPIRYGRFSINDYHAKRRRLTVPEIFIYSSNIGTARIAQTLGETGLRDFYAKLGFFTPVPVDLPERGKPLYPRPWKDIHTLTGSFGHGIAVTPLHITRAAAALVNGGILVTPHIIKDNATSLSPVAQGLRVVSADTSEAMRKLMSLTVVEGTGGKAKAAGYDVGGKTGTAEKNIKGRYVRDKLISSFLAAFPMREPRYVVLASLDEPKPSKNSHGYATGGWTGAPVVGEVVAQMAPLYGIDPDFDADGMMTRGMEKYLKEGKNVAALSAHR